ncbi:hypothetical protein MBRA1_000007 [Malassezia brasiliensis]|uniref:Uncharacterized protein n=1 Tax=Malassezia brasiliensis TaxID=1821822 RepID=A0AAF0DQ74_9BASI|nr:hypothetical protein MBRA1_000007 [Malassezia brasiliensis]
MAGRAERAARGALALRAHEQVVQEQDACVFDIHVPAMRTTRTVRGTCVLTNERVRGLLTQLVVLPDTGLDAESLDVPLHHVGGGRYQLPLFSAPYYEVEVPYRATPDAAPERARLRIRFHEGGADAFRRHLPHARDAWEHRRHERDALRTSTAH